MAFLHLSVIFDDQTEQMLIDTHAHLYLPDFQEDREAMTQRAEEAGVGMVVLPNIDEGSIPQVRDLVDFDPGFYRAAMGLHPCSVRSDWRDQLALIRAELDHGEYIGVGEIGTDRYWDLSLIEQQEEAFAEQLRWGRETGLPVIIHSRDSLDENIEIVTRLQDGRLKGIFHCFNGTVEQGKRILDLGFLLGMGGVITFKNANMGPVVAELPLEGMVLETDAPYLAPVPHRGKRNESAYVRLVAEKIAEFKDISQEEVEKVTTNVALSLFLQTVSDFQK